MEKNAQMEYGKHPVGFLLKFLLFVLIFSLITIGLKNIFSRFSPQNETVFFGTSDLLNEIDSNGSKRIIILDAGHGGEDGGTSSDNGTLEKDLNLSMARLLSDFLRADGIDVILTRDSDRLLYDPASDYKGRKKMLDLKTRLEIARKIAAENPDAEILFISLHMNSYPSENVKGLQVWYSPNASESLPLAESIQSTVQTLLQTDNHRKVKKAGSNIFLLDRLELPSVLIECGFLSNPEEAQLLSEEEYRRKLAFAIYTSITNYDSSEESEGLSKGNEITDSIVPLTP